ncbi:MAG: hypothetical protein JXO51_09730 [Candidatus Aminicenantes bacterium]|nr:hypothetical protein [Candidatus Aminicenantes bacterium]
MNCAWFEVFSRIPLPGLRLRLCRWHVGRCVRCREESDRSDPPLGLLVVPDLLPAGLDLWPGVRKGIDGIRPQPGGMDAAPSPLRRSWRWATAAAVLLLALLAGFWTLFLRRDMPLRNGPAAAPPEAQVRLCSAKIADRPARVFQVQSRSPDRAIFWIVRDNSRS